MVEQEPTVEVSRMVLASLADDVNDAAMDMGPNDARSAVEGAYEALGADVDVRIDR